MKIVAIANQKGGVGKTTTTVNLGVCLGARGARILIVDLDPQANCTSALGYEESPEGSLYEPLIGAYTEEDEGGQREEVTAESRVIETRFKNVSLIPSALELAGTEIELAQAGTHLTRLREVLLPLKKTKRFDFVLIDCPPSLGVLMTSAVAGADELLIPLQCEYFGLEGLSKIVDIHSQLREAGLDIKVEIEGIVMTMFVKRTNHAKQVVKEVKKHFPEYMYKTIIPRTIRLAECASFGRPIIDYEPKGIGAQAYKSLAKEFLKRRGWKKR